MANNQIKVQNLSTAAKRPATLVMSLWPVMIFVAVLSLKIESDASFLMS